MCMTRIWGFAGFFYRLLRAEAQREPRGPADAEKVDLRNRKERRCCSNKRSGTHKATALSYHRQLVPGRDELEVQEVRRPLGAREGIRARA